MGHESISLWIPEEYLCTILSKLDCFWTMENIFTSVNNSLDEKKFIGSALWACVIINFWIKFSNYFGKLGRLRDNLKHSSLVWKEGDILQKWFFGVKHSGKLDRLQQGGKKFYILERSSLVEKFNFSMILNFEELPRLSENDLKKFLRRFIKTF